MITIYCLGLETHVNVQWNHVEHSVMPLGKVNGILIDFGVRKQGKQIQQCPGLNEFSTLSCDLSSAYISDWIFFLSTFHTEDLGKCSL